MIISRTPFRVSLFGGAIDKYCYINVRALPPFFEHKHRIVYSNIELVKAIEEIRHPSVRAVLREMEVTEGLEIHHDGDLPARSGLGSSSSFTVGLLNALHAYRGRMRRRGCIAPAPQRCSPGGSSGYRLLGKATTDWFPAPRRGQPHTPAGAHPVARHDSRVHASGDRS